MIRHIFTLIGLLTFTSNTFSQSYPQHDFISPLDVPLVLSGTYGELRSNHFHAGIDIKTQGVEGLDVKAAADGEIVRIAVSPYGYGNALYIRHSNGYTTVYAHLREFSPAITKWVEEQQYQRKSFAVNLFPSAATFPVIQGEVIAKSGNSGGSGGPHLHFEIRDSRTEEPLNPLLFGFDIPDHRTPEVRGIYAYPIDEHSHVNQRHQRTSLSIKTIRNGEYSFKWPQRGAGKVGFAIDVIDRLDGAWNSNGPYTIQQYVNGEMTQSFVAERFAFDETRYLNAHIDYDLYDCCQKRANRMWIESGNQLSMYRGTVSNGVIALDSGKTYDLEWKISDVAGNTTSLKGSITFEAFDHHLEGPDPHLQYIPYNVNTTVSVDEASLTIHNGTLYHSTYFEHGTSNGIANGYGKVYQFGETGIPAHRHVDVSLPLAPVPLKYHSKTVVVSLENDLSNPDSWDGKVNVHNGQAYITAGVRAFGNYTLMVDSVAPALRVLSGISEGSRLSAGSVIKLKMTDDLSGINSYECTIDGQWHLMSYDAKNDLLQVVLSDRINAGEHIFEVVVTDDRNNKSTVRTPFTLIER